MYKLYYFRFTCSPGISLLPHSFIFSFSVMQSAQQGSQQKKNPKAWSSMVVSTLSFTKTIFLVTGKDMGVFMDQWIRVGGHARFHMEFVFNRKRNTVEMVINQQEADGNGCWILLMEHAVLWPECQYLER